MHNDQLNLLDAMGLEAGKDWELWKRPSTGKPVLCVTARGGCRMADYILNHPEVYDSIVSVKA